MEGSPPHAEGEPRAGVREQGRSTDAQGLLRRGAWRVVSVVLRDCHRLGMWAPPLRRAGCTHGRWVARGPIPHATRVCRRCLFCPPPFEPFPRGSGTFSPTFYFEGTWTSGRLQGGMRGCSPSSQLPVVVLSHGAARARRAGRRRSHRSVTAHRMLDVAFPVPLSSRTRGQC